MLAVSERRLSSSAVSTVLGQGWNDCAAVWANLSVDSRRRLLTASSARNFNLCHREPAVHAKPFELGYPRSVKELVDYASSPRTNEDRSRYEGRGEEC